MKEDHNLYFQAYLQQFNYESMGEVEFVRSHLSVQKFDKGDYFLENGQVQSIPVFYGDII